MSHDRIIRIVKAPPSDELSRQILYTWFRLVRPKWIAPVNWSIVVLCGAMTIFYFNMENTPPAVWAALAGFVVALAAGIFQVPLLVNKAVQLNKKSPYFYVPKHYDFYRNHVTFSCEGLNSMNIPYEKFTKLVISSNALLFLYEQKLAMWIELNLLNETDLEEIYKRFEDAGVRILLDSK